MAFFDELVRPGMGTHAEYVESLLRKEEALHPLAWRNELTKRAYENATVEVRAAVNIIKGLMEKDTEHLPDADELTNDVKFSALPLDSQDATMKIVNRVLGVVATTVANTNEEEGEGLPASTMGMNDGVERDASALGHHEARIVTAGGGGNGSAPVSGFNTVAAGKVTGKVNAGLNSGTTNADESLAHDETGEGMSLDDTAHHQTTAAIQTAASAAIAAVKNERVGKREMYVNNPNQP
jgi:hypothetical protein